MTKNKPGLSFVIPVYDEENCVADTIERLHKVLSALKMPFEIIAVNDGSKDGSAKIAKATGKVTLLSHPVNCGYGATLKTGIRNAQYEWIGIVDADGTYDIERLPDLVEKMREGFDMAICNRLNISQFDSPTKRLFRTMFRISVSALVHKMIEDPNSGFRLFQRSLALSFFPFLCDTFSFTTSITVFAFGSGRFVTYVPMDYHERTGRSHVRHVRDTMRTIQLIIQGTTFFNPLKFYLLLVLVFLLGVAVPAMAVAIAGFKTGAFYYLFTGAVTVFLVGLGIACDILRIATMERPKPHEYD